MERLWEAGGGVVERMRGGGDGDVDIVAQTRRPTDDDDREENAPFALLRVALHVADIDSPTRHIAHVGLTERRRREGGSISCALSFVEVDQNR